MIVTKAAQVARNEIRLDRRFNADSHSVDVSDDEGDDDHLHLTFQALFPPNRQEPTKP